MNNAHVNNGIKILVVDDDKVFLEYLHRFFVSNHLSVELATDAFIAMAKFKSFNPNIILLDILMPGLNGMELMNVLRHQYPENTYKIYLMSVLNSSHLIDLGLRQGALDFFQKPLSLTKVLNRMMNFQNSNLNEV